MIRAIGSAFHQLVKVHNTLGAIGDGIEVHVVGAGIATGRRDALLVTALRHVAIQIWRITYTHRDGRSRGAEGVFGMTEIITHIVGLQLANAQRHRVHRGDVRNGGVVVATLRHGHSAIVIPPEDCLGRWFRVHCATQLDLIAHGGYGYASCLYLGRIWQ